MAAQWHFDKNGSLAPCDVTEFSNKKVWWRCALGHEWETSPNHRSRAQNCPYCSNKRVWPGFNDLETLCPQLAQQWHPNKNSKTPQEVSYYSNQKAWWQCKQGHEWQAIIANRSKGRGCPFCSNKQILPGYNDLRSQMPALAEEWDLEKNNGLTPEMVSVGSNKIVWWKCRTYGHAWEAAIYSRAAGQGCPYCSNRRIKEGFNDLKTKHPLLAREWHPEKNGDLLPTQITVSSGKSVWWQCAKGHEWKATPANRSKMQNCPYCSGHRVLSGFNDLASQNPILAAEWHSEKNPGILPSMVSCGSGKLVWWQCSKGHAWQASVSNRTKGKGCPVCWSQSLSSSQK